MLPYVCDGSNIHFILNSLASCLEILAIGNGWTRKALLLFSIGIGVTLSVRIGRVAPPIVSGLALNTTAWILGFLECSSRMIFVTSAKQ